ncbi:MAG: cupin domain-containing protein [Maritimibacter sp.]|nr:cupin domain-containing protein [Maritimibacter sp.]
MDEDSSSSAPTHGIMVAAETDRFSKPFEFLDAWFNVVLSGRDTGGAACAIDTNRRMRGGPPLHVHHAQDEWFFVREGEFEIVVGDTLHHLRAGDSLLAPRGIPHAFANSTETGRMLVTFFPAGEMEEFFHDAAAADRPTPPEMAAIFARHGMTVVGPPLAVPD